MRRRRALERLVEAQHDVTIRGPEGEQVHFDEKGKRVRSKARVEYKGFQAYMKELQVEAGLLDPRVEIIAEELRRADTFWGPEPTLGDDSVVVDAIKKP